MVGGDEFTVKTPVGPRRVVVGEGSVRAELGAVQVGGGTVEIAGDRGSPGGGGNPPGAAFVDACCAVPIAAAGPLVEFGPAFPGRTNAGFATVVGPDRIDPRGWGRGGGGTAAGGAGGG